MDSNTNSPLAMDMFNQRKKTTGRKKIEIKKLDKNSNKQVTFSKRRVGLFRKASELCILCNVQAAIIVFSPADKLFCFGQPNTDAIISRYLEGKTDFEPSKSTGKSVSSEEYNRQHEEAMKILELEKKRLVETEALVDENSKKLLDWWNEPIDEMSDDQLKDFMVSIYELRKNLAHVMMLAML